jgi:uncharacterized protein with FMN-binding domain
MTAEPREPARLPIRGTIATVGTVGALTLLLSFRGGPLSPTEPILAADETPATDELIAAQAETESTGADAALGPVSYTGDAFETRWGDVRVEVTLDGTDIIDVVALQMPDTDRHTVQLGAYVEPILRDEAIAADSADVSVISGATYTSEAYADSLQSALDQATMATADASVADAPEAVEPGALAGPASDEVRTATGDAVAIRWGDVQVAVRVEGDDIVDVETIAIPADDRRSQRINTNAEPILREEAIASDSADVSVVSGATYTSQAYARSLQSALDQLGI